MREFRSRRTMETNIECAAGQTRHTCRESGEDSSRLDFAGHVLGGPSCGMLFRVHPGVNERSRIL